MVDAVRKRLEAVSPKTAVQLGPCQTEAARSFRFVPVGLLKDTFDRVAYGYGILSVLAACLAASLVPAFRASRIDPAVSLRQE